MAENLHFEPLVKNANIHTYILSRDRYHKSWDMFPVLIFSCLIPTQPWKQEDRVPWGQLSLIYSQNVYEGEGSLSHSGESVSGLSFLLVIGIVFFNYSHARLGTGSKMFAFWYNSGVSVSEVPECVIHSIFHLVQKFGSNPRASGGCRWLALCLWILLSHPLQLFLESLPFLIFSLFLIFPSLCLLFSVLFPRRKINALFNLWASNTIIAYSSAWNVFLSITFLSTLIELDRDGTLPLLRLTTQWFTRQGTFTSK